MARHHAVVVEPQQRDHVAHVGLDLDPARAVARLAGEDRVVVDPARRMKLGPDVLRKAEVRDVIAVQMAISRRPTVKPNSLRVPYPPCTPGQEVTSAVIRSLAVPGVVMTFLSSLQSG